MNENRFIKRTLPISCITSIGRLSMFTCAMVFEKDVASHVTSGHDRA